MQVRVKREITMFGDRVWRIQVRRWWLPIWVYVETEYTKDAAILLAEGLKHQDIEEIV